MVRLIFSCVTTLCICPVMLRHQTTWLESGDHRGLAFKYLCWSPRSQMEMVQLPMKNSWLRSLQKWLDISPGLLKKRHVLCTKCDMPYLVSTMDVSVVAEMLSANIVSWRLGCACIWFASKEPTDSLQPHFQTLILSAPYNGVRDIWIILSEIFY